jgi:large subunit ribosomal protein L22
MAVNTTEERELIRAQARYVRSSARKARLVLEHIRGLPATDAEAVLRFQTRAVAKDAGKVLKSAMSNAENNFGHDAEDLVVVAAYADEGPTLKRWRARARGRVNRIRKRTCHITITVSPALPGEIKPRPVRAPRPQREAAPAEEAVAEETAVVEEETAEETPAPKPKRTRKPKAAAAPAEEEAPAEEPEAAEEPQAAEPEPEAAEPEPEPEAEAEPEADAEAEPEPEEPAAEEPEAEAAEETDETPNDDEEAKS